VVEVMGRHAGYIALYTGIACGATAIITTEMPFDISDVTKKIESSRKAGKNHFIVVVSEGVGNSQKIADEIHNAVHIDCRATILGHVQRGGSPTVRDRVEASRMGYYAVELLEKGIGNRVVGIQHGDIVDVDIQEALSMKKEFPKDIYNIANEISI
ncbi:MAG: 6-phosphofructokinase, partial [Ruminiclostridium sp.]|nr:6-phosphofructokinase [Ruminiclostridium sp.]